MSGLDEFAPKGGEMATKASLADAAQDALGETGPEASQEALIPACKVKFNGMSYDSLDDVPDLKQEMVFKVKGRVVAHEQIVTADGEVRDLAKIKVSSVTQIAE